MTPSAAVRPAAARPGIVIAALIVLVTSLVAVPTPRASAQDGDFDRYAADRSLAQDHADVFRLYWAFFDRKPEVNGARYWVGQYDRCVTLLDITWAFGNSTEFRNTYGSLSDRDYVTLVYRNVLDRRPDDKGYAYWTGLLSSGELSREELMLYFSLGSEFRRKRPLPSDGRAYGGCTPPAPVVTRAPTTAPPEVYYANCDEVRAAGRAPLMRGEPGYRSGLDRDDDGVACEWSG